MDVFHSYASLFATLSHGNKPKFSFNEMFPEWWADYVKEETDRMRRFFETIRKDCNPENGGHPLYIVRYEDLILKPKATIKGLFAFLLGVEDLTGTNAERRID